MPRFDRYMRQMHVSVDGMFAERVRIIPWTEGGQDTSRSVEEVTAPLRTDDRQTQSLSGDRSGDFHSEIRTGGAVLKIDTATYPDLELQKGDKVVALDRPGEPRWRVSSVDRRGHGRLIVNLGDN